MKFKLIATTSFVYAELIKSFNYKYEYVLYLIALHTGSE